MGKAYLYLLSTHFLFSQDEGRGPLQVLREQSMKALFLGLFLGFLIPHTSYASPALCPTQLTLAKRPAPSPILQNFMSARLYTALKQDFAHWETVAPGFNFEKDFQLWRIQALAAHNRLEFDQASWLFFSKFNNGHTQFRDESATCPNSLGFRAFPLSPTHWIISESTLSSLKTGDELIALEGQAFQNWAHSHFPYLPGSSQRGKYSLLFQAPYTVFWPAHFHLTIKRAGQLLTFPITRILHPDPTSIHVSPETGGIIRLKIPGFYQPEFERQALETVRQNQNAPALLFDLRGTSGGTIPLQLLFSLLTTPTPDMLTYTPDADGKMKKEGGVLTPDHPLYHGPVYALTDRDCVSACEGFLMIIKISKRARIFGEATRGMNDSAKVVKLPDGFWASIGHEQVRYPDNSAFEGVGVEPDVPLSLSLSTSYHTPDPLLQATLSAIQAKLTQSVP